MTALTYEDAARKEKSTVKFCMLQVSLNPFLTNHLASFFFLLD